MSKRNILVTGGCGFIGSNFILEFLERNHECRITNIDLLTYASDESFLKELENSPRYSFVKGDICDRATVEKVFKDHGITDVIHFAAESHVDNSISGPESFVRTNVLGTFILLDVARATWMEKPHQYKEQFKLSRFHHVSTDEVYGSLGSEGLFSETTPYAPNSPYSATKAGSDFIVRSYFHTFGMNVITTNCSNNYGPRQHDEKFIPTIIRKAISHQPIPIYGNGSNVRDWLFVVDHCHAIETVFFNGRVGETYNIGSNNEQKNTDIVHKICSILDELRPMPSESYRKFITFVSDRPGHDQRYAIDASKIEKELNWKSSEDFENGLRKTVKWYLNKYS